MAITPPAVTAMNVQQQGAQNFPVQALWVDAKKLSANTHSEYSIATLIANAGLVNQKNLFLIFSADGPFYANFQGANAAIPSADVLTGSASELNPNQRLIDQNCRSISFIAAQATIITIQVFQP